MSVTEKIKKARDWYVALFLEKHTSNHSISNRSPLVSSPIGWAVVQTQSVVNTDSSEVWGAGGIVRVS